MIKSSDAALPVLTLAIGAVGGWIALRLALPAPFLIGPAALVTVASLAGLKLRVPQILRNVAFLSVGLSMGAGVTPDVLQAASAWPLSFMALLATSLALLLLVYVMLQRGFRYDPMTAMLGACPGHLSYVLSLAAGVKSDLASVGIIQSVRVLALTLLVPLFVEVVSWPQAAPVQTGPAMEILPLALMAAGAALVGSGLLRARVPAALLVGGMVVSSALHLSGLVEGTVPAWVQIPVYIVLGSMIGSRFAGVSLRALGSACLAGASVTLVAGLVSVLMAFAVSHVLDVPLPAALIAFAPGGLETMAAMAVILHADPAYVGTHHIVRLVFLSFLMPAMILWIRRR